MWKRQRACCESFAPSVIGWMGRSAKKRTETCHRRHANGDNKSILREWLPQMVDMLAQNRERKGRQWMFGGLFPEKTWLGAVHGVSSTIQKKYMSTRSCCWFFFFFFQKAQQSRRTNDGKRMRSVPFIISWQLAVRCLIGFHRRLWLAFRKSQTPPILVLSPDRCIWEHLRFVWPNFVVKCCSSSKLRVLLTQTKATCPLSTVPVDNAGREWSTVKKLRSS